MAYVALPNPKSLYRVITGDGCALVSKALSGRVYDVSYDISPVAYL